MPQNKKIGEPEGSPSTATQIRWLEVQLQAELDVAALLGRVATPPPGMPFERLNGGHAGAVLESRLPVLM